MFYNGYELIENNINVMRAGIIPYTVKHNMFYFLMGVDRRTRELTDFGGGVKINESLIDGALRELHEESCEIFVNTITKDLLIKSPVLINKNSAIFFVCIDDIWLNKAEIAFKEAQENLILFKKHIELIGVKWIDGNYFKSIAFDRHNRCMWSRIQNIFRLSTNWLELYQTLIFGPNLTNSIRNYIFY
jgi:hypothetical protein